ncbi:MAG: glycine cleavage system H protein [Herpetosiphonaceae bacterium]|nr:MAG: glycine cleavage system H protein [Herpetosiphonaceae bacterium]
MAYQTPEGLQYAKTHEWVKIAGDEATMGITDYAQHALGDIVFVELPEVGKTFSQGDTIGVVESVKAASDIYAPVSGEVIAVNEALLDAPEILNQDPYERGWIVRLRLSAQPSGLMDAAAYEQHVAEEEAGH